MRDLETGAARGLSWRPDLVGRVLGFFRDVLRLAGGEFEGRPFAVLPWQAFVLGSLFGWLGPDGYRRFRVAYIETAKGSGKSPLLGGIGLYMLTADGEARAEVYAAATKRDQALVLFRDAVSMVEQSPALQARLHISGGQTAHNIAYLEQSGFFRPIGSDERGVGQSGPRPHCALLDEIHEHPTNAMVEFMRAGTKARRQALIAMITNSGHDKASPCYQYHDYGARVSRGDLEDDGFFAYICALDEGDDPLASEDCWPKANPSLDVTPGRKYLREQVREARGMPAKAALVRRLNFCEWVGAGAQWIDRGRWESALHPLDLDDYAGRTCYAALDLSAKADLTALALVFPCEDGTLDAVLRYWTPAETMRDREARDRAPYSTWATAEYLTAVPGRSIDYGFPASALAQIGQEVQIARLAFDRWRIDDFLRELDEAGVDAHKRGDPGYGIELIDHGQGFKDMSPAIEALEHRILQGTIRIARNPVTTWCAANARTVEDPAGNRKFTKMKSTGRIDGMVALAMAVRIADGESAEIESIYDARHAAGEELLTVV